MRYSTGYAVTPSDTVDIRAGDVSDGLYVGGAGNIAALMSDGKSCDFAAVPAGTVLPVAVKRVLATGTTATNIRALKF
jgi:hypothetical protein